MNSGLLFSAERYSSTGYWNSWTDCQRHMFWLGAAPDTVPFGVTAGLLVCQVVFGPSTVTPSCANTSGNAGVASVSSSASVQLRLPLPPWPACTNQSRPQGVSCLAGALLTTFFLALRASRAG